MKITSKIVFFFLIISSLTSEIKAQIQQNAIAYYSASRGNCGMSSFTFPDSIYNAILTGASPILIGWEISIDKGSTYTVVVPPHLTSNRNYLPAPISQTTFIRRIAISGIDTSHSNAYIFYTGLLPLKGNTIVASKSNTIPCAVASYAPGNLTSTLTLSGGTGDNYGFEWFYSTDGVNYKLAPIFNQHDYSPAPITQTTWYKRVLFSPAKACVDSSNAIKFTFTGLPGNSITPPTISSACNSVSFSPGAIIGSTPTGATFYWQSGPDSSLFTNIAGATQANYTPSPISVSTFYRRVANLGSCSGGSNSVLLSVSPPFSANTITANQVIDSGTAPSALMGNLVSSGSNPIQYRWEQSTDSVNYTPALGANAGQNYQPIVLGAKTYYHRIALAGNCSVSSNTVSISIKGKIIIPPPPPPPAGCSNAGSSADLGVKIANKQKPQPVGSQYDYFILVTNYSLTTNATSVVIKDTLPSIINYVDNSPGVGQAVYDDKTHILTWTINNLPYKSGATLIITVNPTVNDQIINSVTVSAIQCDPDLSNNTARDTLNNPIPILLKSDIPDIITPNGDGKNDIWVINNFIGIRGFSDNEILILDRWGNQVFYTKGYQNNWDGKGLATGTYFYVLRIKNGSRSQTFKGHITLLR